jgi:polyhydroxyalkanoate synthesis regulator phasin
MYATEKYVKMEAKELRESINQLATDLGGDIRYLDERISDLKQQLVDLQQQLQEFSRNTNE